MLTVTPFIHISAFSSYLPFFLHLLLPLNRQSKDRGSHYKQVWFLTSEKRKLNPAALSASTCSSFVQERGELGLIPIWRPVNTQRCHRGGLVTRAALEDDVKRNSCRIWILRFSSLYCALIQSWDDTKSVTVVTPTFFVSVAHWTDDITLIRLILKFVYNSFWHWINILSFLTSTENARIRAKWSM